MATHIAHTPPGDAGRDALDRRLDDIGWALLFIMVGSLWLVPGDGVPFGAWLAGFGLLLLGVNAVRRAKGIAIHPFGAIVGALLVVAGLASLAGIEFPLLAIALIVVGIAIIVKPLLARHA